MVVTSLFNQSSALLISRLFIAPVPENDKKDDDDGDGDFILGDVNKDSRINNTDIILLGRSYMSGTAEQYLSVGDMNNDKKINNTDIILLGRVYMDLPNDK